MHKLISLYIYTCIYLTHFRMTSFCPEITPFLPQYKKHNLKNTNIKCKDWFCYLLQVKLLCGVQLSTRLGSRRRLSRFYITWHWMQSMRQGSTMRVTTIGFLVASALILPMTSKFYTTFYIQVYLSVFNAFIKNIL